MTGKERRRLERFELHTFATIEARRPGRDAEVLYLQTRDISSGGAYFRSEALLPEGTRTRLLIHLPLPKVATPEEQGAQLKISGTVLRSDQQGMAIIFDQKFQLIPAV
jgi:c-di-GMP-binding flagellar brake protein YcgR